MYSRNHLLDDPCVILLSSGEHFQIDVVFWPVSLCLNIWYMIYVSTIIWRKKFNLCKLLWAPKVLLDYYSMTTLEWYVFFHSIRYWYDIWVFYLIRYDIDTIFWPQKWPLFRDILLNNLFFRGIFWRPFLGIFFRIVPK